MPPNTAPSSLRAFGSQLVRGVVPSLAVYFGLRAFGAVPYIALCVTVVFSASYLVFEMVRGRGADPLLLALIVFGGTGALVSFVSRDVRYAQLSSLPPGTVVSVCALASVFTSKPLTLFITEKYWPNLSVSALRARGWEAPDIDGYLRAHARTTLVCALLELTQILVVLAAIFTCSADVAQLFIEVGGPATTFLIVVFAVRRIRGASRAHEAATAEGRSQSVDDMPVGQGS
ncbi:MAG: hypothetical protein ACRC20_16445 [Segniliparus sp.]